MCEIWDHAFLLRQHLSGKICVDQMQSNVNTELGINSIAFQIFINNPSIKNINRVFSITHDLYVLHIWNFTCDNENCAIVISTKTNFHYLFINLLKNAQNYFKNTECTQNSESRFNIILSFISSWFINENQEINALTFNGIDTFKVSNIGFSSFELSEYFDSKTDYTKPWKSMILNRGVLVISKDIEDVAPAVFSVLGLVSPFEFKGKFLITTNSSDKRIYDNRRKYSIVGLVTPNAKISNEFANFGMILRVKKNSGKLEDTRIVHKRQKLLYDELKEISDRNIERDPYHELLNKKVISEELETIICEQMKKKTLTVPELMEFEETKTFQYWICNRQYRGKLRNSFLSALPLDVVSKLNDEDLEKAYSKIIILREMFCNDRHFLKVLKKHKTLIGRKLGKNNVQSPSSDSSIGSSNFA